MEWAMTRYETNAAVLLFPGDRLLERNCCGSG